jgi:hypothetical protein
MREAPNLQRLDGRPVPSRTDEIRAFMSIRNEISRLPFTLAHHRNLGVHRFLVIDNGSCDGTIDYLLGQPDVHVFTTTSSYQDARNGIDWIEMLLHFYGADRWCLLLDADEHLVYPACESIGLPTFCIALEERGLNCLATLFLDLYADRPIAETHFAPGQSPLETCHFFDPAGYYRFPSNASHIPRVYGGPRARLFWPEIDLADYAGRIPSYVERAFDEDAYLTQHADVAAEVRAGRFASGLQHFLQYGRLEGRAVLLRGVPDWPEHTYRALHPDVNESVIQGTFSSGLEHYLRHGQFEGRLFWNTGPPCVSQVPLLRWDTDMRLGVGRHQLLGGTWRRNDAVGGAMLHFKLVADLVVRADATVDEPATTRQSTWALENQRYREGLRTNPTLSAMRPDSASYRDAQQLIELAIITPLSEV